jgi:UDP-2,3-diacylglucosamine pyrophosphatase LpxH
MSNVLVIGDLHSPFILEEYFQFINKVYKDWKCNRVVFIGDIFDFHIVSRHQQHPDADGAKEEYLKAVKQLQPYYKKWPTAKICIGNHDARI